MSLHVDTRGESGAELVLLHGWGLSSEIWEPLLPQLSKHYRLTLIDLPGLGRSPSLALMEREPVVDALLAQAPRRALWLGWSLGGSLALAAAARAPERVRGLMLLASTPCFVQRDAWPWAMAPRTFETFALGLKADPARTLNRFALLQTRESATAREELRLLKRVIGQGADSASGLGAALELLREDLRMELAALQQPVMALLGARDPLVPAEVAEALARLRPGIHLRTYPQAAHLPFINDPARFLADLAQLVAFCEERA